MRGQTGVYATVAEARQDGAVAAGWVPEGLPPGATDLRQGHLPDGSHWGLFAFPVEQSAAVRALVGDEHTTSIPDCDPPGRFEWWPRLLRSPMDPARIHATGFRVYAGRDGRTYAINWSDGQAYYWK
jgi:hypothetical protein